MGKTKKYWAVAYGHVVRWAGPCDTMTEAAKYAFGDVDVKRMTVKQAPGNPRYMAQYRKKAFLNALAERHKEKTGETIS